MNEFIIASAALIAVYLVGYFLVTHLIPKSPLAYLLTVIILLIVELLLFIFYYENLTVKAVAWSLAFLAIVTINLRKKLAPKNKPSIPEET